MELAYEELLNELGAVLGIPLKPDQHHTCIVALGDHPHVHLELDKDTAHMILGTTLGHLASGKLREQFMHAALQSNGLPYPRYGIIAYSHHADQFVLIDRLRIDKYNGKKLLDHLTLFADKAKQWSLYIQSGRLPDLSKPAENQEGDQSRGQEKTAPPPTGIRL
jgi:hypothetical protein